MSCWPSECIEEKHQYDWFQWCELSYVLRYGSNNMQGVKEFVRALRNKKAAGLNKVTVEMIKDKGD